MQEKIKKYSIEELSSPEIYQNNDLLASIARKLYNSHFHLVKDKMRMGEFRERILAGEFPQIVKQAWDTYVDKQLAEQQKLADCLNFCKTYTPPDNYTIETGESENEILVKGPYDADLAKRLYRLKGYWDGKNYRNRKCFVIPTDKSQSLDRIFKNWLKSKSGNDQKATEKKNKSEIDRWLGYVENAAKEGRVYNNGVEKLRNLGIEQYPDLNNRLNDLVSKAKVIQEEVKAQPSYGKSWNAQKNGVCSKCNSSVVIGEKVHYRYQHSSKYLEHVDCDASKAHKARKEAEAPYKLGGGSGYGCYGWKEGDIVKSKQSDRDNNNYPEFLYVVEARHEYYREDGLSFGVGDDSGYIYWARCREATEEEAEPLKDKIRKVAEKREAEKELEKIKRQIRDTGERPVGSNRPEGERFFDTQNIYGGGDWFVIGSDWIWYVQNNGMDGDNWSCNNIVTGGAGAIGWRITYDDTIAQKLTELKNILDGAIEKEAQSRQLNAMIADNHLVDY